MTTNQVEKKLSTKIKNKKKEKRREKEYLLVKFKCESRFVIRRTYLTSSQEKRANLFDEFSREESDEVSGDVRGGSWVRRSIGENFRFAERKIVFNVFDGGEEKRDEVMSKKKKFRGLSICREKKTFY